MAEFDTLFTFFFGSPEPETEREREWERECEREDERETEREQSSEFYDVWLFERDRDRPEDENEIGLHSESHVVSYVISQTYPIDDFTYDSLDGTWNAALHLLLLFLLY